MRLVLAQITLFAAMSGARMAFPLLLLRNGTSAVVSSIVVASFAIAAALILMRVAPLIERFGMIRATGACCAMMLAGFGLGIALPDFAGLAVAGILIGAGTNIAAVALQRYAGAGVTNINELRRVFAWMSIGPAASAFFGPFLAGLMIDHAGQTAGDLPGFRAGFTLLAVFTALGWWSVRKLPPVTTTPSASSQGSGLIAMFRTTHVGPLLFINTCVSTCWEMHNVVLPILGTARDYSASTIGAIMGALALAAAGVRLVTPRLLKHVPEHRVMRGSIVLSLIALALYPLAPNAWLLGVAAITLGMTLGIIQPILMTALYQSVPDGRQSAVLGARLTCVNGASVITPLVAGSLSTVLGPAPVFFVASALLATNFGPLKKLRHRRGVSAP